MKILYLVGTLGAGGLERFVTRICILANRDNSFQPEVCCLIRKEGLFLLELQRNGIPVHEAPVNWTRSVKGLLQLKRQLRAIQPDIVHSMVNFSIFQQTLVFPRRKGTRFFITERSCYIRKGWRRLRKAVQYHWVKLLGGWYGANSREVAKHLARVVGTNPARIPVITNGVPIYRDDTFDRERLRLQFGWNSDQVIIGSVGSLTQNKGYRKLIIAQKSLLEQGQNTRVVLIGDGPERQTILNQIQDLSMSDCFELTGIVDNVEEYLIAMDIFILVSEREGMPNALLEAMSAGKPVIATKVGGIPELVEHGKTGILLENSNPEHITSILLELIKDPSLRTSLGCNARANITKFYGIDQVMQNLLVAYTS